MCDLPRDALDAMVWKHIISGKVISNSRNACRANTVSSIYCMQYDVVVKVRETWQYTQKSKLVSRFFLQHFIEPSINGRWSLVIINKTVWPNSIAHLYFTITAKWHTFRDHIIPNTHRITRSGQKCAWPTIFSPYLLLRCSILCPI